MDKYNLSVAFCATNESEILYEVYSKISRYNCAGEYIFILSKTASDKCIETVKLICAESKCRWYFQQTPGLGNAIREAIDKAQGSHIIIWPADDGMDTEAFPKMVELSKQNPDKIITVSRWLKKNSFHNYGTIRKFVNYVSQKMFALLYRSSLTDFTNPTQIAPLDFYRSINWQGGDWSLIPELIFKPLKIGCAFIEVPCDNFKRKEGRSNASFFKLAQYYIIILKIYFMPVEKIKKRSNR